MEYINVICKDCQTNKNAFEKWDILYDEENIINIINSNYSTCIDFCVHNIIWINNFLHHRDKKNHIMHNYNNILRVVLNFEHRYLYGYFMIGLSTNELSFLMLEDQSGILIDKIDFLQKIKANTILEINANKCIIIPKLEKILIDAGFIIKQMQSPVGKGIDELYVIDTLIRTKCALKT